MRQSLLALATLAYGARQRMEQCLRRQRLIAQKVSLLALFLPLLLAACGRPEIQPLVFEAAPWRAGEVSEYAITNVNGAPAGTARYEIAAGAASDQPDGWTIKREIVSQGVNEVVTVAMTASMRPITSQMVRVGEAQRQESVAATFDSGLVNMELTTVENVTTYQRVNVPSDAREGNIVLMLVRALPLAPGYATRINAFLPVAGLLETFVVEVQGTEQITVPAGVYETYKVELSTKDYTTTAWYAQDNPHTLVKYIDGRNQGEFVLTDFQPGPGR